MAALEEYRKLLTDYAFTPAQLKAEEASKEAEHATAT